MHGGDPMKRSVDNQLITQMFCGMLFSYLFFQPLFAWRIIIGPITPRLSVFASIVDNIFKNWMGVCFTQMAIFKVSTTTPWLTLILVLVKILVNQKLC